jgi:hypothetical protein
MVVVLQKYITLIKDMYKDAMTCARTCDGDTSDFPIKIGLHQGSALSPYLFALMMDEVTRDIQGDICDIQVVRQLDTKFECIMYACYNIYKLYQT